MEFSSGEQTTGVGLQDANGTQVKLAGVHAEYPREALVVISAANVNPANAGQIDLYQTVSGVTNAWSSN